MVLAFILLSLLPGILEGEWVLSLGGRLQRGPAGQVTEVILRGAWVSDSDLERLRDLPHLTRLDLSLTRITDQGLLRLEGLQGITELNLYYAELITDEGAAALKGWSRLERLNLRGTRVTDTTLAFLSGMSNLVSLDVGFAQITDTGLQHLSTVAGLRELSFGGNKLTEQGLRVLYSLQALTRLDVSGRQRTDSGLWSVSVSDLGIDPIASLRELNLSGTQISAAGLEKLATLANLEKLHLFSAKRIGDEVIPRLQAFPRLRWVDLKDTAITRAGVDELRRARPRLTVLWE